MDKIGQYMKLGAIGLLALFIIIFALFGLIHGRKKAIYRWITFAVYAVIVFVLSNTIIKFIFDFDISSFIGGVLPSGFSGNSVSEIIKNAVEKYVGTGTAANQASELATALVMAIFKLVYYIVMIIAIYIIYWLITQIIWLFIKGKRKDPETGEKLPKYRAVGAALGALKGLVVYVIFLTVVINGPLSLIPDANATTNNTNNQQLALDTSSLPIDDVMSAINEYKESPFYSIFGGSKEDSLNDKINDYIWTAKYGDTEVNIRNELQVVAGIAVNALDLIDAFGGNSGSINLAHNDYVKLSEAITTIADSDLIMNILPLATNIALNLDQVKNSLPAGIDLSFVNNIDWEGDINAWGQLVLDSEELINGLNIGSSIDFSSLATKGTAIEKFFTTLSTITLLTECLDVAVCYVISSQGFDQQISNLTQTVSDIVWKDDIKQLGKVLSAFLDLGYTTFDELGVSMVNTVDIEKATTLVKELFALQLLKKLLPVVMDVVLKDVDASLKALFNFDGAGSIDFENEFVTLLSIVKEARGTGATPEQLFTTEGSINFNILTNLRTETLLSSELLSGAIKTLLIQAANNEGLAASLSDVLVIPTNLTNKDAAEWQTYGYRCEIEDSAYNGVGAAKDTIISETEYTAAKTANKITVENWKKVVVSGELYNVLDGLKAIITSLNITSFSDLSLDASLMTSISEDDVEKITESTILNATVTKLLLNMMGGGGAITIPASAITSANGVNTLTINSTHNELLALVKAIKSLGISDFANISISTEMLTNLLEASDPTKYICITAVGNYAVNDEINTATFDALDATTKASFKVSEYKVFAYTDGANQITPTAYETLSAADKANYTALYTNLDRVLDSDILSCTFSGVITNMSGTLSIPDNVVTEVPVYDSTDKAKIVDKTEITNLIKAIDVLDIDFSNMGSLDVGSLLTKMVSEDPNDSSKLAIDTVNESQIMLVTLSDKIDNMAGSILIIPTTAKDTNDNITKTELKNLFIALDKLDIEMNDLSALQVSSLMAKMNEVDEDDSTKLVVEVVCDSKIMHATISKKIIGMESSLTIPLEVRTTEGDANVVTKAELKNLVVAIDKLGLNLDNMDGMNYLSLINELPNTVTGTSRTKLDYATDSAIIYCVISKAILDQAGTTLVVTGSTVNSTTYSKDATNKYDIINKTELSALVKALGPNGLGAVNNGTIGDVNSLLSNAVLHSSVVSASEIMRATITDKLPTSTLTIEADAYDVKTKFGTASSINVATETEMNSLLTALDILGVSDFSSVDIGLGKIFSMLNTKYPNNTSSETEMDYILKSGILWATVNSKLTSFKKDGSADLLTAPTYGTSSITYVDGKKEAYDKDLYDDYTIYRYTKVEVKAILGAFSAIMGPTTGDSFEISATALAGIYSGTDAHRLEVANAITDSVVMTMNIKNLVGDSINNVAGDYKDPIEASLNTISYSEWKYYDATDYSTAGITTITALNGRTDPAWRDGQLYKLLTSLNSFSDFVNFNSSAAGSTAVMGKKLALDVNNSRVTGVVTNDIIYIHLFAKFNVFASNKYTPAFGESYSTTDPEDYKIYSTKQVEDAIDAEFTS